MTFPSFRSITGGSNSNSTTPSYDLPAPIVAGDAIIIVSSVDAAGTLTGITGFSERTQQAGVTHGLAVFAKVANGTEGGTTVSGSGSAAEATTYISIAVRDWSGDLADIVAGLITSGDAGANPSPAAVTAPWGAADNMFVAIGSGDYWNRVATGWPAGYTGNQTTQQHANQFGGTQCLNLATKNAVASSDNPGEFIIPATTTDDWTALGFVIKPSGGVSEVVIDVDGDNAVNQYQLVTINVSNFTETITSVLFGTEPVVSIPDNDPTDDAIQVRVPGNLATGTYDVTVSGATETDVIQGISYTQTHPINIPAGAVDSNSILADQGLGVGYAGDAYMTNPAVPYEISGEGGTAVPAGEVMAFKAPYTDWSDAPIQNDIMDYLEAPEDFAGWMRADFTRLYSDGTTASWSVETQITPPPQVVSVSGPINGTYGKDQALQFTVSFDYAAYVTGTPRLALDFEGATRYATYVSGTGTTALVFEYVVQSGDYAPNGVGITALGLNGGTIANGAGQAADLTLNGVADTSGVLAGTAPHLAVQIDSVVVGGTSATINVSYPGANLTGYEYNIGGGWVASSNPIQINTLDGNTTYPLDISAVNEFGRGDPASDQFTTDPAVDTRPADFTFTAQTDVALGGDVQSNAITILGVDAGVDVPASIVNGSYRVSTDGGQTWGGWTTAATNVRLNYQIELQHTAAATYSTNTDTIFTAGGEARTFRSTTLADNISPTITLNAGDINWPQGTPFVDPGYSASDNAAGNITGDVEVTGTIDVNVLGPQTLTYTVGDGNNNSTTVTRTVTVVPATSDLIKPVITLDEGNVDWPLGTPWVDPGYSASDNVDGNLTGAVQVSAQPNVNQPGTYTITYSVTDSNNNTGTATRTVTVLAATSYPFTGAAPDERTFDAVRVYRPELGSKTFVMKASEILDYDFNLAAWLAKQGGDTLSDTFEVTEEADALQIQASGRVSGTDRIKVWLSAGTAAPGESYPVQLKLTTNGFRTAVFHIRIIII